MSILVSFAPVEKSVCLFLLYLLFRASVYGARERDILNSVSGLGAEAWQYLDGIRSWGCEVGRFLKWLCSNHLQEHTLFISVELSHISRTRRRSEMLLSVSSRISSREEFVPPAEDVFAAPACAGKWRGRLLMASWRGRGAPGTHVMFA